MTTTLTPEQKIPTVLRPAVEGVLDPAAVPDQAPEALDDAVPTALADDALEAAWVPVWTVPELDLVDGLAEFLADAGIIETLA